MLSMRLTISPIIFVIVTLPFFTEENNVVDMLKGLGNTESLLADIVVSCEANERSHTPI